MSKPQTKQDQAVAPLGPDAMRRHAQDAARLMSALGNESRLLILCALAGGERSVGELNDIVPLSQSALSQHLARLRRQELVVTRRMAQSIFYSLRPGPAHEVIGLLHDIYCPADGPQSRIPAANTPEDKK